MRHEIQERKSKANRREEEGNARDGDLRIDLASGVAVINIPGRSDDGSTAATDGAGESESSETADATDARPDPAGKAAPVRSAPPDRPAPAGRASPTVRSDAARSKAADEGSQRAARRDQNGTPASGDQPRPVPRPSSKASRAAR